MRHRVAIARAATVDRLVGRGLTLARATAWVDAWDESTRELLDFRRAPDFWELGYRYALEEERRGYEPPIFQPTNPMPPRGLAVREDGIVGL